MTLYIHLILTDYSVMSIMVMSCFSCRRIIIVDFSTLKHMIEVRSCYISAESDFVSTVEFMYICIFMIHLIMISFHICNFLR